MKIPDKWVVEFESEQYGKIKKYLQGGMVVISMVIHGD